MKTSIEERLGAHFRATAEEFEPRAAVEPAAGIRRARGRIARTVALGAAAAVAVGWASVSLTRTDHAAPAQGITQVRLVQYVHDATEPDADGSGLRAYASCMRDEGYDVPDPVRTEQGWTILVPAGSVDRSSPRWREAAFVTCSLERFIPRPLSGDLVMGFDRPTIDRFIACMGSQGFDLPMAEPDADGNYRWPLDGLGIDTRSDPWNRAVFVTCSPTGD
jgi:hypothetical protein